MTDYACPNGHPFPMPYAVNCRQCSALVAVEPVSVGMALDRQLREAKAEWEHVRDEALSYKGEAESLRAEHRAFMEALTAALSDYGVPAMPSWREAIDYLARHGRQ